MLTLLTLTISMVMLYMVLQSTQMSGSQKRYKNSLDAAVGGVDIVAMDALPYLISFAVAPTSVTLINRLNLSMNLGATTSISPACFQAKLTSKTSVWQSVCGAASSNINARDTPDFKFVLQSTIPYAPAGYNIY